MLVSCCLAFSGGAAIDDSESTPEAFVNVSTWLSTVSALPGHAQQDQERVLEREGLDCSNETERLRSKFSQEEEEDSSSAEKGNVTGDSTEMPEMT